MPEFEAHLQILIGALLFFSLIFLISYWREASRVFLPAFAIIFVLSGIIIVLARWAGGGDETAD